MLLGLYAVAGDTAFSFIFMLFPFETTLFVCCQSKTPVRLHTCPWLPFPRLSCIYDQRHIAQCGVSQTLYCC
jgi:hypothetical protein